MSRSALSKVVALSEVRGYDRISHGHTEHVAPHFRIGDRIAHNLPDGSRKLGKVVWDHGDGQYGVSYASGRGAIAPGHELEPLSVAEEMGRQHKPDPGPQPRLLSALNTLYGDVPSEGPAPGMADALAQRKAERAARRSVPKPRRETRADRRLHRQSGGFL